MAKNHTSEHGMELSQFLLVLLLIKTLTTCIQGDLLSSSKVEKCLTNGAVDKTGDEMMNCTNKMIILYSVVNGKRGESDMIQAMVETASDPLGMSHDLANPFQINIGKGDVYLNYELQYLQNFNSKPREEFAYKINAQCSEQSDTVSCGWLYNELGAHVKDSQGFCCVCHAEDMVISFFSFGRSNRHRYKSHVACTPNFWHPLRKNSSVHCLRMNDEWYATYRIGTASTEFTISLYYTKFGSIDNIVDPNEVVPTVSETLFLSPSSPLARSADGNMVGKLTGDLASYKDAPSFTDRYLSVPLMIGTNDRDPNTDRWLAVEKLHYTLTGDDCDKIGVSYTAFNHINDCCNMPWQACLANQLADFWVLDQERINRSLDPSYSLAQYGPNTVSAENSIATGKVKATLKLLSNVTRTSLITLELKADKIRWAVHVSPGKIISASIRAFAAMSRNGWLYAEVQNIGRIIADFTLTVTNCSDGIENPQARLLSLEANVPPTIVTFTIHAEDDYAASRDCRVTLYDNDANPVDTYNLYFNTSATVLNNGSQGFNGTVPKLENDTSGGGGGWGFGFGWLGTILSWFGWGSCSDCSSAFCFIINMCWSEVLSSISGIMSAIGIVVAIGVLWWTGLGPVIFRVAMMVCKTACRCVTRVGGSKGKSSKKKSSHSKKKHRSKRKGKRGCIIM